MSCECKKGRQGPLPDRSRSTGKKNQTHSPINGSRLQECGVRRPPSVWDPHSEVLRGLPAASPIGSHVEHKALMTYDGLRAVEGRP